MSKKPYFLAAAVAAVLLISASPALAHVTPVQRTAPADGYATIEFQVPHGCDGAATEVVSVQLRDDITAVKAQAIPGWEVSYDRQPLDEPIEIHGREVDDYIAVVTWTAEGDPLPDDQFMRFGISMKMPDLEGEQLLFPAVQDCVDGSEAAWVDADPDSDYPAPVVELLASTGGHGADDASDSAHDDSDAADDSMGGEPTSDEVAAGTTPGASSSNDSDGVARMLGASALALAAVGAAAGIVSLRRRSA